MTEIASPVIEYNRPITIYFAGVRYVFGYDWLIPIDFYRFLRVHSFSKCPLGFRNDSSIFRIELLDHCDHSPMSESLNFSSHLGTSFPRHSCLLSMESTSVGELFVRRVTVAFYFDKSSLSSLDTIV